MKEKGLVLIYTDGIIEAKNRDRMLFGFNRLKKVVAEYPADSAMLVRQIVDSVDRFSLGQGQSDDLTLVCFKKEALF